MTEITFELRPTDEYIELIKLLKLQQIAQSGAHAKIMVEDGVVKVNGKQELRKRNKLKSGYVVEVENYRITIV